MIVPIYKVVRDVGGQWRSYIISTSTPEIGLGYELGKRIAPAPGCGPLVCGVDEEEMREFFSQAVDAARGADIYWDALVLAKGRGQISLQEWVWTTFRRAHIDELGSWPDIILCSWVELEQVLDIQELH